MGNIYFKRGKFEDLPKSAPAGMPLWCIDTEEFYIGTGDRIRKISGGELYACDVANRLKGLEATIGELNYSCGLKGNIQEQLDSKLASGDYLPLLGTAEKAKTLEGLVATINELNYSSGLTGNIQLQLDQKQPAGSYLLTTDTAAKATADAAGNVFTTTYEVINKSVITLATSGTIALTDNSINKITPAGTVTFTLPSVSNGTFHQILVQLNMTSVKTINLGTTYFFNKTKPDLSTAGTYSIIYEYDSAASHWVCGVLNKGVAS